MQSWYNYFSSLYTDCYDVHSGDLDFLRSVEEEISQFHAVTEQDYEESDEGLTNILNTRITVQEILCCTSGCCGVLLIFYCNERNRIKCKTLFLWGKLCLHAVVSPNIKTKVVSK